MTHTAGELAAYLAVKLAGDPSLEISGVANPERAGRVSLIYVDSVKMFERAARSAALCVIARPEVKIAGKALLEAEEPKLAFAKAAAWLLPRETPVAHIHPTAVIAQDANLHPSVSVGPYVVIESGTRIGARTVVEAFTFVGQGSRIGENCWLHPHVTLYGGSRLGDRVEVHSGTVIGSDGFGYVFGEGRQWKFPQVGDVELADDVEIGANTTIDRGSLGTTAIGSDVKIDNLVQIAHNVQIGDHSVIAAQTGVSGSTTLGKHVVALSPAGHLQTARGGSAFG